MTSATQIRHGRSRFPRPGPGVHKDTALEASRQTEPAMALLQRIGTGGLCAASLCLLLLFPAAPASAVDRINDEYLTGYMASVLERDLHWERGSYLLKVVNGVVTVTLFEEDSARRAAADKQLRGIDGVQGVTILVRPVHTDKQGVISKAVGVTGEGEAFPVGDLFRPLLADPKQPQFFVSFHNFEAVDTTSIRASVGFGETFGLYRWFGNTEGNGLQLSLEGALFAQFDMESESADLLNADYTLGFPLTYKYGDNSLRFRVYHQSSHLGDELLLGANPPDRVNLSFEALELIYSREWQAWRVYGGGEYLVHKEPEDLLPVSAHWGIEYRGSDPLLWNGRPIVGVDMKSLEEHDWDIDTSIKVGLEFGHPNPGQRRLRVMAEWYKGFDPHGQFYANEVQYYGLGVSLGF